jgi:hypothetical protein
MAGGEPGEGLMMRPTMSAIIKSQQQLHSGPGMRSRPILRSVPHWIPVISQHQKRLLLGIINTIIRTKTAWQTEGTTESS